jgi:hypothetical protein
MLVLFAFVAILIVGVLLERRGGSKREGKGVSPVGRLRGVDLREMNRC